MDPGAISYCISPRILLDYSRRGATSGLGASHHRIRYQDQARASPPDHFQADRVNTPYGWYTFDTSTLERRPVDTRPGSWDYFNLWLAPAVHGEGGPEGDAYSLSVGSGGRGILGIWGWMRVDRTASEEDQLAQVVRKYQFIAANPWPAFEPWYEILLPGQKQTRPTVHRAIEYETWTNVGSTYTGYLRLTCGDE